MVTAPILTVDGAINILGTGNGSGASNYGLFLNSAASQVIATGSGTVSLTGTGSVAGGSDNDGINMLDGQLYAATGNMSLVGTAGAGSNSEGLFLSAGTIGGTYNGTNATGSLTLQGSGGQYGILGNSTGLGGLAVQDISLIADTLNLGSIAPQGTGNLTIAPLTPNSIFAPTLGTIADGFSSITLGNATTGTVNLSGFTASDPVTVNGANINLLGAIDGAFDLTLNSPGLTTINGAIGSITPLTSFTTDAAGSLQLLGGTIATTNGAILFNDAVTLGANTIINAGSGAITFASTIDGGFSLDLNSTGLTTLTGAIGANPLTTLTTNAGGTTVLNANINATGNTIIFNDALILTSDVVLDGGIGGVQFNSTVDGDATLRNLTVNSLASGSVTFADAVGASDLIGDLTI
ncbi:MAG: beta strand repeat-containing protein, partial [Prochlorotrichaceae cyanobacterium]